MRLPTPILVSLSFGLSLLVGACQPVARPTAITFMVFGDPVEVAAYQRVADAYQAAHPDRRVELIVVPSQSAYRTRLAADFAAGAPADVVLINYRRLAAFVVKGAFEPLGPYLDRSAVISRDDFYPQALKAFTFDEQVICIPQNISSPVVYYNRDLFDAAGVPYPVDGWLWEDFLAAARALTRDTDGDGLIDQHGLGVEPNLLRLAPFVWQNGGTLVDDRLAPTRFTLDTGADREALQWFVDLQVKWRVVPSAVEEQSESSESRFLNGRAAMYINSRRGVPTYREAARFDWDVSRLPDGRFQASVLHSDAYCIPTNASSDKDAVWSFVEFANSVEGQTIVAATGRTVPSLVAVAESPAFLASDEPPANSRAFLRAIPNIITLPRVSTWPEIEELADEEIEQAFYGRIGVDEAVRNILSLTGEEFRRGVGGETD